MSTHKHFDRICVVAVVLSLLITILFMNGEAFGILAASKVMGYENRLFDTSKVHTIDIVMDDWDGFVATCTNEEYAVCNVVIDGEAYKNVGIRAKGNTSLSTVASMNSDRYSFKIEFDQYDSTKSYHGLDKLSLNNLILDTTYMKDYLAYRLMASFGVDAPLCSYVYITVNGEEWGLYLAVEGVEDAFLQRNYGNDYGELYKPDSGELAGGRGNGQDFDFNDFINSGEEGDGQTPNATVPNGGTGTTIPEGGMNDSSSGGGTDTTMPNGGTGATIPEGGMDDSSSGGGTDTTMPNGGTGATIPEGGMDDSSSGGSTDTTIPEEGAGNNGSGGGSDIGGGMFDAMSSDAVKLQYLGDDPSSYTNIFENAKTDISEADMTRLIESLKALSNGERIETVVNVDEVIRYFVVNNFLVNGDSYVGSMVHNYYLYEENGQLSLIPWDYNLAYGTFHTLQTNSAVNDPIDTPLSVTGSGDRPMMDWILNDEAYLEAYHQYFAEFLAENDVLAMMEETLALIMPYVEKDPTRFYTISEVETGVETLRQFLTLRIESVQGQLNGAIPATKAGQTENSSKLVATDGLVLSSMGAMNMGGFGGNMGGNMGGNQGNPGGNQGGNAGGENSSGGNQNATTPTMPEDGTTAPSVPGGDSSSEGGAAPAAAVNTSDATDPTQEQDTTIGTIPNDSSSGGGSDVGDNTNQGNRPGNVPNGGANSQTGEKEHTIPVWASVLTLLFGLVFAFLYKRR